MAMGVLKAYLNNSEKKVPNSVVAWTQAYLTLLSMENGSDKDGLSSEPASTSRLCQLGNRNQLW